ncbi:dolichol-phosphate mannosyltransferase subunit 3 [Halyomorpha halys]|uniref:dolichol-phosphate mannosyltransferase subunit 3 n=1 Tax=Halyomorpha halys TaxID=286706 RepID=UPI0006D4EF96|nr:dolichol-phosphate mannosyltransferase subunit 3 [Halyomorpha halys]
MTKLIEWLCFLIVYIVTWLLILNKYINLNIPDSWSSVIVFFPVYTVFLFGVYSLIVVLWRVYSFNDCPEAAKELQQQIKAAREDLKLKGLKF